MPFEYRLAHDMYHMTERLEELDAELKARNCEIRQYTITPNYQYNQLNGYEAIIHYEEKKES